MKRPHSTTRLAALAAALIVLIAGGGIDTARADWSGSDVRLCGDKHGRDKEESREMSKDDAVRMVKKRYNADVVRTDTQKDNGQTVYHVRLMDKKDGRIWTVKVNAVTGAMQ